MVLKGESTLEYLGRVMNNEDPASSSHWNKYHAKFEYKNGIFHGIEGFGGNSKRNFIVNKLHLFFQGKFRIQTINDDIFNTIDKNASKIVKIQNKNYDIDVLRLTLTLNFLKKNIFDVNKNIETACVIGDGFGTTTAQLLANKLVKNVILVNLTKTLLVDLYYLKLMMGEDEFSNSVHLVTDRKSLKKVLNETKDTITRNVIAIEAKDHKLLKECPVDIAINIASMQEMNPSTIIDYFEDLRVIGSNRKLVFYCCNRIEKRLPDGKTTRFFHYPWSKKDIILFDELCPWHQEYYSFIPPFYRSYDGPIQHRLCVISGEKEN